MSQKDTAAPGYADRFAYVIWLRAAGRIDVEDDNDVERGAGVTRQWIQKWRRLNQAPKDRLLTRALVRFLNEPYGWDVEEWLLDGVGEPPEPALWKIWNDARLKLAERDKVSSKTKAVTPPPIVKTSAARGVGKPARRKRSA